MERSGFRIGGSITRIAEIRGDATKTPIIFAPPFGSTLDSQRSVMTRLAELSGGSVAGFETRDLKRKPSSATAIQTGLEIPGAILRNARNLAIVINRTHPEERVTVIGQSMGAASLVVAHELHNLKLDSALLVSPAGLIPKPSIPKIYLQFAHHTAQGAWHMISNIGERTYLLGNAAQALAFHGFNVGRLIKEGNALAIADLYSLFRKLSQEGVNVGIIAFREDLLTPADELQDRLNQDSPDLPYREFQIEEGGHHPTAKRSPAQYAEMLYTMLQRLYS